MSSPITNTINKHDYKRIRYAFLNILFTPIYLIVGEPVTGPLPIEKGREGGTIEDEHQLFSQ